MLSNNWSGMHFTTHSISRPYRDMNISSAQYFILHTPFFVFPRNIQIKTSSDAKMEPKCRAPTNLILPQEKVD
jgi:hypothetical protein